MFSIILPLYNKEMHVYEAIKSVLNQSFKNFELIVVDDGSTDNSLDLVNKITDDRLKVFSQVNSGVSSARNFGILKSKFENIAFIDADDLWKPNYLEEIYKLIELFPEAKWFCTGYSYLNNGVEKERIVSELKGSKKMVNYFEYSIFELINHVDTTVIKKDIFDEVGYFPLGVRYGEDQDLFSRIALKYKIAYSGIVGANYVLDSENRACNVRIYNDLWPFLKNYKSEISNNFEEKELKYTYAFVDRRMITKAKELKIYGRTTESLKIMFKHINGNLSYFWWKSFIICIIPYKQIKSIKNIFLK